MTRKDIFKSDANLLVCPTNGVGSMGAGLALRFKQNVSGLFEFYADCCKRGYQAPGQLQLFYDIDRDKHIVLFPTKRHWRDKSRIEDIELGLQHLRELLDWFDDDMVVAMPRIGCGLGGLSWKDVKPLIQRYLKDSELDFMEA